MSLWVHVHGGYASYDGTGIAWGQLEYDAFKLVQTLKGKPINKYATLKRPDGKWITITTESPAGAFELWQQWAGAKLNSVAPGGAVLVPVPSSDCLTAGGDAKGRLLADTASRGAVGFTVADALHWAIQYPKASEGGPRDYPTLFENIRVKTDLPKREVVLIDDVVTGGGHLRAAADALRWAGHKVEHAVCVAHTVHAPPPGGMWNIPAWDLEAVGTN